MIRCLVFATMALAGSRTVTATIRHCAPLGWFLLPIKRLGRIDAAGLHRCHGLAVRPGHAEVWSACGAHLTVHATRRPGFPEIAVADLPDDWLTFTPDGQFAFAALSDIDTVVQVDASRRTVVCRLAVGRRPKRNLVLELEEKP